MNKVAVDASIKNAPLRRKPESMFAMDTGLRRYGAVVNSVIQGAACR